MNRSNPSSVEPLEPRQLLAGVTMLIHGHQGSINGWVRAAAEAIAEHVPGGADEASQYILKVAKKSGKLAVTSFTQTSGPVLTDSSAAEAIVKLDWTAVDDGSYSTEDVGNVVAAYMLKSHGSMPALAELPMQFIGHSRGASVAVVISKRLGEAGAWVDQDTFLDPHPVPDLFGFGYDDAPMKVYANTIFADNYWRDDGNPFNFDPDGQSVDGAHNVDLNDTVQQHNVVSAHMAVTAYYHGTIDLKATNNRDQPIFSDWYGDGSNPGKPARNRTGYYFSRLVGGSRPADGLSSDFGGTAERNDQSLAGAQWANVADLRIAGGSKFSVGDRITVRFRYQDRDSASRLTLVLDPDNNPFNGNEVRTMKRLDLAQANSVTTKNTAAMSGGVDPGTYYIQARITDADGHMRFAYSKRITLTA